MLEKLIDFLENLSLCKASPAASAALTDALLQAADDEGPACGSAVARAGSSTDNKLPHNDASVVLNRKGNLMRDGTKVAVSEESSINKDFLGVLEEKTSSHYNPVDAKNRNSKTELILNFLPNVRTNENIDEFSELLTKKCLSPVGKETPSTKKVNFFDIYTAVQDPLLVTVELTRSSVYSGEQGEAAMAR